MTEYINKSKALHEMWQRLYAIEDKLEKEHGLDVCERHDVQIGFEAGLQAIVSMPTINIVHCGECKHRREYTEHDRKHDEYVTYAYCTQKQRYHGDDWFCANGERKNDND